MRLRAVLMVALLVMAACGTLPQVRYYTLASAAPTVAPAAAPDAGVGYRVAIGPVTVPEALDRPQIVLRMAPNRYAIADTERWAEPLKREIPRVLAADAGQRLPAARVAAQTQYGGQGADYRVPIDILRFESVPAESITLEAAWSVRNAAGERLHEARFVQIEKVEAPGVAPLVSAHAKALAALAEEIAVAVQTLVQAKR